MEVPLRGQLGEKLVADLIREVAEQKSTGLLRLSQDKTIKAIFFESGAPVFAISSLPHEQIDQKLIKGRFAAAGLVEAAKKKADNPQKLGRTLVQTGVATEHVLQLAASELATQIIMSLFEWDQGDYVFNEGPAAELDARLKWTAADCIVNGTREVARLDLIANRIAPGERVIAQVILGEDAIGNSATLTSAEGFVLSSISVPTPVSELGNLTGLSDADTRTAVCVLLALGLVKAHGRGRDAGTTPVVEREVPPTPVMPASEDPAATAQPTLSVAPATYAPAPAAAVLAYSPPVVAAPDFSTPPPVVLMPDFSVPPAPAPPPAYSPSSAISSSPYSSSPPNKPNGRYSQVSVEWVIEMASRKLQSIASANYYEVLGLDQFATTAAVQKAYDDLREMFSSFRSRWPDHTELNGILDGLFAKIDQAYATLSDSNKRRIYDMPATLPQRPMPVIERGGPEAIHPARRLPGAAARTTGSFPSRGLDIDPSPGVYTSGMRGGVLKPELAAEEHYRRGRAHFDRKDFHSAAHLFREAVNLDATQGHYHYFLGVTLSVLSQARKAHNHDEGCHVTCKIGGALVRNQRVRREAEQHLLLAADLDRKNPEIRVRLGLLYKDAGMEKKAEQYFNEALMLDASNQIALRELGLSGDHIPRPEYE
ncbi:MAG TPA: DUF4388 domain-containing protein [Blastocatellia bacterium]|nr:DUF4388 domain-containing protein [Blastocatellia bacterium]